MIKEWLVKLMRNSMRREDVAAIFGDVAVEKADDEHFAAVRAGNEAFAQAALFSSPGEKVRCGSWHGTKNRDGSITFTAGGARINQGRFSEAMDCAPPQFCVPDGWRWGSSFGGRWTLVPEPMPPGLQGEGI